jgi:hypothetical protein
LAAVVAVALGTVAVVERANLFEQIHTQFHLQQLLQ